MTRTARKSRSVRLDLYRDAAGKWRWRAFRLGHIVADCGYGYSRRIDCIAGAANLVGYDPEAVAWHGQSKRNLYGQAPLFDGGVVELHVWRKLRVDL